ncbi:hypothetical protein KIPB_003304, partial [Kipferlia bialata]
VKPKKKSPPQQAKKTQPQDSLSRSQRMRLKKKLLKMEREMEEGEMGMDGGLSPVLGSPPPEREEGERDGGVTESGGSSARHGEKEREEGRTKSPASKRRPYSRIVRDPERQKRDMEQREREAALLRERHGDTDRERGRERDRERERDRRPWPGDPEWDRLSGRERGRLARERDREREWNRQRGRGGPRYRDRGERERERERPSEREEKREEAPTNPNRHVQPTYAERQRMKQQEAEKGERESDASRFIEANHPGDKWNQRERATERSRSRSRSRSPEREGERDRDSHRSRSREGERESSHRSRSREVGRERESSSHRSRSREGERERERDSYRSRSRGGERERERSRDSYRGSGSRPAPYDWRGERRSPPIEREYVREREGRSPPREREYVRERQSPPRERGYDRERPRPTDRNLFRLRNYISGRRERERERDRYIRDSRERSRGRDDYPSARSGRYEREVERERERERRHSRESRDYRERSREREASHRRSSRSRTPLMSPPPEEESSEREERSERRPRSPSYSASPSLSRSPSLPRRERERQRQREKVTNEEGDFERESSPSESVSLSLSPSPAREVSGPAIDYNLLGFKKVEIGHVPIKQGVCAVAPIGEGKVFVIGPSSTEEERERERQREVERVGATTEEVEREERARMGERERERVLAKVGLGAYCVIASLDPESGALTHKTVSVPDTMEHVSNMSATYVKGKVYVFGGSLGDRVVNTLWVYTVQTDRWNQVRKDSGFWPSARRSHSAFCINGHYLVVAGGQYGKRPEQTSLKDTWVYDTVAMKWDKTLSAPFPLPCSTCAVIGDNAHVVGNYNNYHTLFSLKRGNKGRLVGSWRKHPDLPFDAETPAVIGMGGRYLLVIGKKGRVYDTDTREWGVLDALHLSHVRGCMLNPTTALVHSPDGTYMLK